MAASPYTVLYVEDNVDNRILVRRILQAEGYRVLEAGSARESLQVVKGHRPDLILVDINMPGVDGYTLTAHFKSDPVLGSVPVVAITANVMRGDRERTLSAGCDGYIQKPIDVDSLPRQLARFLPNHMPRFEEGSIQEPSRWETVAIRRRSAHDGES